MECVICFETAQLYVLRPCLHQCLCLACLSQLALKYLRAEAKICCPLCRAEVKWIYDVNLADLPIMSKELGVAMHATIKLALTHQRLQKTTEIVHTTFIELLTENPSCLPFMTKNQMEEVIKLAEIKHATIYAGDQYHEKSDSWKRAYVAACITPWNVKNGGSGVCYQGNLRDEPDGLIRQLALLKTNMKLLVSCDSRVAYKMF